MSRFATISLVAALTLLGPRIPGARAAGEADREAFQPQILPTLEIHRAAGPIRIDGDLEDEGWKGAARAANFAEVSPGDQTRPHVDSEAWIAYDEENLYVALIAQDDPSEVRVSLRERDRIFNDDYFGLMLDTYGELGWGYEIFVNPIGIQGDLRIQSDGNEDMAFDIVWDSRGKVTETGYQVEIAIPFASLRFPDKPKQTWRANFWRDHQREVRRRYAWAAQDRDNPCFLCQWGTLTGVENIKPGKSVDIIANVLGSQSGSLASSAGGDESAEPEFENDQVTGEASLNVRWGITSNTSAEAAINPDFSQVESDASQIDVNSTFALFYPERRPFFQEGSDLYSTWIDAIYTRSINNPDAASKFTGQFGKTSLVATFAKDADSPMILPLEERSEVYQLGESMSGVARVRRALHEESFIGGLATTRGLEGGGFGSAIGTDAAIRFLRNYRLEGQIVASRTDEPQDAGQTAELGDETFDSGRHTLAFDGESFWGDAAYMSLERSARLWNSDVDYWRYSPTFRTDNGFTTRNDWVQGSWWNGLSFNPNKKWLVDWEPSIGIGRVWNTEGRFKDEWIRPHLFIRTNAQTDVNLEYLVSRERFAEEVFPGIKIASANVNSRFSEVVSGGMGFSAGRSIYRSFSAPELGRSLDLFANARIKPMKRIDLQPEWSYSRMESQESGTTLFEGYILRTRFNYNFSREWSTRIVLQYDEFDDRFDVEPLVTYRVNPFTVFFAGLTSIYDNQFDQEADPRGKNLRLSSRQLFAKVQYLFRY